MAASQPVAYTIELFDTEKHDRAAFSCGVEQVDNYFQKTANKLAKADNVRLYVMVDPDGTVMGFCALNAHAVQFTDLPAKFARTRPSHGNIPAAYISMIGRDRKFSGGGFGGDLLVDALRRIAVAADAIGVAVVMLDVLDCGDPDRVSRRKALYESYGFQSLASNPLRMFMPVSTVRRLIAEEYDVQKKEAELEATPARLSQEIVAAKKMLARTAERHAFHPDALAADKSYGTGPFLAWLLKRDIAPHVPVLDRQHQTGDKYDLSHFSYDAGRDSFTCLEGHEMTLRTADPVRRVKHYSADTANCKTCPIRKACTTAPARTVMRHMDEEARQIARNLSHTEKFAVSRRKRKKVEMLFAHLKRNLGFTRLRLRGLRGASDECILAATAQNLKRLAKLVPA